MKTRITSEKHGLDVKALVVVAVLLAAGAILKLTVGSVVNLFGMKPNFIIATYCLAILLVRPTVGQAAIIGLLAGAVCQVLPGTPYLNFVSELLGAIVIAGISKISVKGRLASFVPAIGTFLATLVSGSTYTICLLFVLGADPSSLAAYVPIVLCTAAINTVLVQALYVPCSRAYDRGSERGDASRSDADRGASSSMVSNEDAPEENACAPAIEMRDVSFSYGSSRNAALDGVSLRVERGEFVGVIGPSGAGKSTLAMAAVGAIPHHTKREFSGSVSIFGRDVSALGLTDVAKLVGFVMQDIDAQMVATRVEDEIAYGLENFGVDHGDIPRRIDESLERMGIVDLRDREIASLSGGQKQKVAIAAVCALGPHAVVLDEPTAALDPASSREVFELLKELNERQGVTVLVIEQKVALLAEFCERVMVLDRGRIALEGPAREVFSCSARLMGLGVDRPRICRIASSMARRGMIHPDSSCLTLDEAFDLVRGAIGENSGEGVLEDGVDEGRAIAPSSQKTVSPIGDPVLSLRSASFSYGAKGASVDDVSFDVRPGEFVAVVGENGAGKTTLTKLIAGLLRPSGGSVVLAGRDVSDMRASEVARHVSVLFQNPDRQICRPTVAEEISFGMEARGEDASRARQAALGVVRRFGLDAQADPFALSRGQRQMVALASAVASNPEVLVLDEPTNGLDYRECMTVMEEVERRRMAGCAVVMVCHDMEVVSDFATRVVVMAGGRVLADGPTDVVFSDVSLMERARIGMPQVCALSSRMVSAGFEAFRGVVEVSDFVKIAFGLRASARSAASAFAKEA